MNHPAGGIPAGCSEKLFAVCALVFRVVQTTGTNSELAGCDSWSCNHVVKIPYLGGMSILREWIIFLLGCGGRART